MFVGILGTLIELVFLIITICAVWLLVRELATPPRSWRAVLITLSLILFSLAPIQLFTGYSVAFRHAPAVIYLLSIAAYFLAMILLWRGKRTVKHLNRIMAAINIVIPLICVTLSPMLLLVLLIVIFETNGIGPLAEGRISPTISYQIFVVQDLTTHYEYKIYRNPRWFPLIQKEVGSGEPPCGPPAFVSVRPEDISVHLDRNEHTLSMSCRYNRKEFTPVEIPLE
jgi:hypothetical protein